MQACISGIDILAKFHQRIGCPDFFGLDNIEGEKCEYQTNCELCWRLALSRVYEVEDGD